MKTYAVFLFDDAKKGFERYTYLQDIDSKMPEVTAYRFYNEKIAYSEDIKIADWDARITINDVRFASQTVAYIPRNGGKAIVLAERIK